MPIEGKIMAAKNIYHKLRDVRTVNGLKLDSHHKCILYCFESRGKQIYPSYKTIAADAGCSTRTAQRKVLDLKNAGIIEVVTQVIDNRYTSNRYILKKESIFKAYDESQSDSKVYPV